MSMDVEKELLMDFSCPWTLKNYKVKYTYKFLTFVDVRKLQSKTFIQIFNVHGY